MDTNSAIVGPWPVLHLGETVLPTYYLVISAVLIFTTLYVYKRADKKQYSGTTAMDLYLSALVSGAVGARLFHVFYEMPGYYFSKPWEIFYFWQGGFVFLGGAIGGFLGGWVALLIKKQSFPMWLDFFAPVVAIGYALGRLACYFTGCCHGVVCDWPWATPFTKIDLLSGQSAVVYLHPTQLYAVAMELGIFATLLIYEKRKTFATRPGHLFAMWVQLHCFARMVMELYRGDDRGWMLGGNLSVSFLLSLAFIVIAALYMAKIIQFKLPSD